MNKLEFVGESIEIAEKKIASLLENPSTRSICIQGETGTGKEAVFEILKSLLPANIKIETVSCGNIQEPHTYSAIFLNSAL